jgi:sulfate transport system permease protein
VLVRDTFPGKGIVNSLIDLPFALPTIVAGLTLLALYGPRGPLGINIAYTRMAVVAALLFVTLPFVVRSVQPVLHELDTEMEEAAASLGAGRFAIFRRVIFANIESDRPTAAAAISVVLLVLSFLALLAIDLVRRWRSKHES